MRRPALIVAIVGVAIFIAARHRSSRPTVSPCSFEQTWYQGDIHFSQELVFDGSGGGQWTTGGMASDAPRQRLWFEWTRTETTLTATFGIQRRTVHYEMSRRNNHCYLRFDEPFLPDRGQALHYSDSR